MAQAAYGVATVGAAVEYLAKKDTRRIGSDTKINAEVMMLQGIQSSKRLITAIRSGRYNSDLLGGRTGTEFADLLRHHRESVERGGCELHGDRFNSNNGSQWAGDHESMEALSTTMLRARRRNLIRFSMSVADLPSRRRVSLRGSVNVA